MKKQDKLKKTKIVLYNPCPDPANKASNAPLALMSISAIIYHKGTHNIKLVDWSYGDGEKLILDECKKTGEVICLGITAITGYQIKDGLKIAKVVKEKYPDIPIVWGGWHPSLFPEQTCQSPFVDIVVAGQGERTFTELVDVLSGKGRLNSVLGVLYDKDGRIIKNPERGIEDINNFPSMPYEIINTEKHIFDHKCLGSRTIHYSTSYGCPHRCGFCCNRLVWGRGWTGLSAERVLDDIERLVKNYKINGVSIVDSNFFVDKERVRKICKGLIERGLNSRVKIGDVNGRTKQLVDFDDELWELMEKSGIKVILTGSESGDQNALNLINKDTAVEDTLLLAKKCTKHNIKVIFSNLAGLPWSNLSPENRSKQIDREIKLTIKMLDEIYKISRSHGFLFFPYLPYPGTPLYKDALRLEFREPTNLEEWGKYDLYTSNTKWVSKEQSELIIMLSNYIFLFLDPYSEGFYKFVKNRPMRFFAWIVLKIFRFLAKYRWKYKFFKLPIDYNIYRYIKNNKRFLAIWRS